MITLPSNSINFIGRLFGLIVIFFIEYLFINFGLKETKAIYLIYFEIILIGFLALTIICSFLSINKVQVDTTLNLITFARFFDKQTIATADIVKFYETIHKNPFKKWYGLEIVTHNNGTIQVAGQNVKFLSDLKDHLNDKKIFYAGQKNMKFPFY